MARGFLARALSVLACAALSLPASVATMDLAAPGCVGASGRCAVPVPASDSRDSCAFSAGSGGRGLRLRGGAGDDGAVHDGTPMPRLRIAMEGNIAAGKSTLLRLLEDELDYIAVPEPLSKWQEVGADGSKPSGGNLLELFYKDPKRWGYTFQTYAFLSRMMAQLNPPLETAAGARHSRKAELGNSSSVVFFERSVFSDRYIFAENCAQTELFNTVEWNIYQDWHTWLLNTFDDLKLDGIIYLRTKPETCMSRCRKRSRSEEGGIPLEYLTQIHERHERWLHDRPADFVPAPQLKDTPILVLECDQDLFEHPEREGEMKQQIHDFVKTLRAAANPP